MAKLTELFNELGQARLVPKTQGQEANISGKLCEKNIASAFKQRGVELIPYAGEQVEDLFLERVLRSNVPYTSIFGSRSKSEFVYYHTKDMSVRIECRAQQTAGSVDEKFNYLLDNAKHRMPESVVWLILSGSGARLRAVEWLKREAHAWAEKIIRVYTEEEARKSVKGLVEQGRADVIYRPNGRRANYHLT